MEAKEVNELLKDTHFYTTHNDFTKRSCQSGLLAYANKYKSYTQIYNLLKKSNISGDIKVVSARLTQDRLMGSGNFRIAEAFRKGEEHFLIPFAQEYINNSRPSTIIRWRKALNLIDEGLK